VVEKLKPMPGWLKRYAELADRGLDLNEIAEQLNVKTETIRKRYDPAYRNYISLAKERVLELYNQGVDLGEAAARVKEELNLTDAMIVKALDLAREDVGLKSSEVRGLEELRREGEEASRRVLEAAREAGVGVTETEVDKDLIDRLRMYGATIKALDDEVNRIKITIGGSRGNLATAPVATEVAAKIQELEAKLAEAKKGLAEIQKSYAGMLKRRVYREDGSVEEEYEPLPDDQIKLKVYSTEAEVRRKQAEAMVDRFMPELMKRLDRIESDISSFGNRLLAILETVLVPELKRRAPRILEDVEEKLRRLGASPRSVEVELSELEARVERKLREGGGGCGVYF
jgi:CRISPR/Cas system CSM-associated protein Csm2 small subunit